MIMKKNPVINVAILCIVSVLDKLVIREKEHKIRNGIIKSRERVILGSFKVSCIIVGVT